MNKEVLQETATTKYLAVIIVNKLTCKDHINQTTYKIPAKLLQNLGQLSSPKLTAKKGVLRNVDINLISSALQLMIGWLLVT